MNLKRRCRFHFSEPYVGLRGLYLDGNRISVITGLSHLSNLRALHLSYNRITSIDGGLSGLDNLMTLNLASNLLTTLNGASCDVKSCFACGCERGCAVHAGVLLKSLR